MSTRKHYDEIRKYGVTSGGIKEKETTQTLWKLLKNLVKSRKLGRDVSGSEDLQKVARMCSSDDRHVAGVALHYMALFMKQMNSTQKSATMSQVMLWSKRSTNVDELLKFILSLIIDDYWSQKVKGLKYKSIYDDSSMIKTDPLDFLFSSHPACAEDFFLCINSLDVTLRNEIFGGIFERFVYCRSTKPYNLTALRLLVWKDCVFRRNNKYFNDYFLIWNQDYDADMLAKNIRLHIDNSSKTDSATFLFALNAFAVQCRKNILQPNSTKELLQLLKTSNCWTQVIGSTFLILKTDAVSPACLPIYLKFFERVMLKENVPYEILLLMLASVIPIREERSLPPPLKVALEELKTNISEALKYSPKINVNWSSDLIFHYALHSNNSFLEARQLILLLQELKNPETCTAWFNKLGGRFPKLKSVQLLLFSFFHFGSIKQKRACLKTLKTGNLLKFNRCLYQCKHETDPEIKIELLEHLFTICKTEEEKQIAQNILASLDKGSRSNAIMLRKLTMILHLNKNFINFWPPSFMTLFTSHRDILPQLLVIEKLLENRAESFGIDFAPKINFILNNWTKLSRKERILPVAFKCLCILCEKGIISILPFWEPLVKRFGSSSDPVALKCLFSFLAIVPRCIIPKTKDPVLRVSLMDEIGGDIIYKSARVLWHFVKEDATLSEDAARALTNYELDNFDHTFLGPRCIAGHSVSHFGGGDAFTPHLTGHISGNCWICLLESAPVNSVQILFKQLIEDFDETFSTCVNIRNLYDNLASYFLKRSRTLTTINIHDPQNRTLLLCMNLLGVQWRTIGRTHIKPDALFRLVKTNDTKIQEILFRMIRVQCVFNPACISSFNDWALSQNISECHSLYLLVVPRLLRHRLPDFTTINRIIEKGLNQYLFKDEDKNAQVYESIISCIKDHEIQPWPKTNILQTILRLWYDAPVKSQGAQMISQLLAMFKRRLVSSIPLTGMSHDAILKMIQLCEDASIRSQSLNAFSKCIEIGVIHKKFRKAVISSLENVLSLVPSSAYNYGWVHNFIQTTTCKTESEGNFLFHVLIISADRISTTRQLSMNDNFISAVDRLPIALYEIMSTLKRSEVMVPLLTKWLTGMHLNPVYLEAIMLAVINLKNSSETPINIHESMSMLNIAFNDDSAEGKISLRRSLPSS